MIVWIWLITLRGRAKLSSFHQKAICQVNTLVAQYPFHLYPVVCKAFELAYLQEELALVTCSSVVEVAIGEGTLSARTFPSDSRVVGLDLSPYSLKHASALPHVKRAIVCDCLAPPIRAGSFEVLVANNFLHHVTDKEQTLQNWSRLAGTVFFNENTRYWCTGWMIPYLAAKLGCNRVATHEADRIEATSIQCLWARSQLDVTVCKHYDVQKTVSYMSERTFFLCSIFSFFLRCYGPPTPPVMKSMFLGPLRFIALPATQKLACLLIRFDQFQKREADVFISYSCRSRNFNRATGSNYLVCPRCKSELTHENRCNECKNQYVDKDGMLFLLPEELRHIEVDYDSTIARIVPREHL